MGVKFMSMNSGDNGHRESTLGLRQIDNFSLELLESKLDIYPHIMQAM